MGGKKGRAKRSSRQGKKRLARDAVMHRPGCSVTRCTVCLRAAHNPALLEPCGHKAMCSLCTAMCFCTGDPRSARCPLCRVPVAKATRPDGLVVFDANDELSVMARRLRGQEHLRAHEEAVLSRLPAVVRAGGTGLVGHRVGLMLDDGIFDGVVQSFSRRRGHRIVLDDETGHDSFRRWLTLDVAGYGTEWKLEGDLL